MSKEQIENLCGGPDDENIVLLSGKIDKFHEEVSEWNKRRMPAEQIVIFLREGPTQLRYIKCVDNSGLTYGLCGVLGTGKKNSLVNMEKFRAGNTNVLFVSNKYAEGYDMSCAKEVWITSSGVHIDKVVQAQGRITRNNQKNDVIVVRVFVYRGCIDDYIWTYRNKIGKNRISTKSDFTQFASFRSFYHESEMFGYISKLAKKIFAGDSAVDQLTNEASEITLSSLYCDIIFTSLGTYYNSATIHANSNVQTLTKGDAYNQNTKTLLRSMGIINRTEPLEFKTYAMIT